MLTPGDDIVEIVAGGDGRAGNQQQDLLERISNAPGLTLVLSCEKCCKSKARRARGTSSSKIGSMMPLQCESERPRNHQLPGSSRFPCYQPLPIPVLGKLVPCYTTSSKMLFAPVNAAQLVPPTGIFETVGGGFPVFSARLSPGVCGSSRPTFGVQYILRTCTSVHEETKHRPDA